MIRNKVSFKVLILFIVMFMCLSIFFTFIKVMALNKEQFSLVGKTILIDAGHGGKDNGASIDDVMEDNINMKISGYLFEFLIDSGAYVLMSRTGDYDLASLYQKNRKREDLNNRVKYINHSRPDIFISVHLNTYSSDAVSGAQVFYQENETSKKLAESIQNRLNVLCNKVRKTKRGDYFILNKSNYTGVLIECGFLSNPIERIRLNDDSYQKKIASKIKLAVIDYFNM